MNIMPDRWDCTWFAFNELHHRVLYEILRLRQDVFVLEQGSFTRDIDGLDLVAQHLVVSEKYNSSEVMGYLRVLPPGVKFSECSIGRVVVHPNVRRKKIGSLIVRLALIRIKQLYPERAVKISAQAYLEKFYSTLGFVRASEIYSENGRPHITMLRKTSS